MGWFRDLVDASVNVGRYFPILGDIIGAKDKKDAAKKANRAQAELRAMQDERNRLLMLRNYQQAQAMGVASWEGSGASLESSGVQGTQASMEATLKGDLRFQQEGGEIADVYASAQMDMFNANTRIGLSHWVGNFLGGPTGPQGVPSTTAPGSNPNAGVPGVSQSTTTQANLDWISQQPINPPPGG